MLENVTAAVSGVDVVGLADAALTSHVSELTAAIERLEAARLAALGEWNARAVWAIDGAYSGACWLAAREPLSRAGAGSLCKTASKLRRMGGTAAALAVGLINTEKARLMAAVLNERTETAFARDEQVLIDAIRPLTVDEAATVLKRWFVQADTEGARPDDREANQAFLSQYGTGGRWALRADWDIEAGAIFDGATNAIVEELRHGRGGAEFAGMTGPQLRAAALIEMARRAAAAKGGGAGARPLVWVVTPAGGGVSELMGAGPIRAETAERLRCDATTCRILVDDIGRIVDLGRTSRDPSPTQRRLLALRDGGCTFPGCDRKADWCEAHHIIFWEHDGPTDLCNLTLLCSFHHHLCHEGGWRVRRLPDSRLEFRRPEGTVLDPPAAAA